MTFWMETWGQPLDDQPSEAALRKACEVLELEGLDASCYTVALLARHFDAEDRLAREAVTGHDGMACATHEYAKRHILPDPKPTVADVVEAWRETPGRTSESLSAMLRAAGLLREDG